MYIQTYDPGLDMSFRHYFISFLLSSSLFIEQGQTKSSSSHNKEATFLHRKLYISYIIYNPLHNPIAFTVSTIVYK